MGPRAYLGKVSGVPFSIKNPKFKIYKKVEIKSTPPVGTGLRNECQPIWQQTEHPFYTFIE